MCNQEDSAERVKVMTIGEKLKKLRLSKHWTPTILCRVSGVSRATIYKIERGAVIPELRTLQRLADALGVSTQYFFE